MSAPVKRWDQFGRYSLAMPPDIQKEISPRGEPQPISFTDGRRRLCQPSRASAVSIINGKAYFALATDGDDGLHTLLTAASARKIADALIQVAEYLERADA